MEITLERVVANFEALDTWEERFRYVIELGRQLPKLDQVYKIEDNRVTGCTSNVWMIVKSKPTKAGIIEFEAESDASIVEGLIAILMLTYSCKKPAEIEAVNIKDVFEKLGLKGQLSQNRVNGFYSMVQNIQRLAKIEAARLAR